MDNLKAGERVAFRLPATIYGPSKAYEGEIVDVQVAQQRVRVRGYNFENIEFPLERRWGWPKENIVLVDWGWIRDASPARSYCNLHGEPLNNSSGRSYSKGGKTLFLYECPHPECTVAKWGTPDEHKSKPADQETRTARKELTARLSTETKDPRRIPLVMPILAEIKDKKSIGYLSFEECVAFLDRIDALAPGSLPASPGGISTFAGAVGFIETNWIVSTDHNGDRWRRLGALEPIGQEDRISFGVGGAYETARPAIVGDTLAYLGEFYPDIKGIRRFGYDPAKDDPKTEPEKKASLDPIPGVASWIYKNAPPEPKKRAKKYGLDGELLGNPVDPPEGDPDKIRNIEW